MNKNTTATETSELEARNDVVRAVTAWEDCDHAVLVENGTDIGPIRRGKKMVGLTDFDNAPYVLVKLNN